MNSEEAIGHMVAAVTAAEDSADKLPAERRAKVYIKIAERWEEVAWRLADTEERAARAAKGAVKAAE
jgi:hypothetical protein